MVSHDTPGSIGRLPSVPSRNRFREGVELAFLSPSSLSFLSQPVPVHRYGLVREAAPAAHSGGSYQPHNLSQGGSALLQESRAQRLLYSISHLPSPHTSILYYAPVKIRATPVAIVTSLRVAAPASQLSYEDVSVRIHHYCL